VFTARYGLIPYMKHVTFRLLKINLVLDVFYYNVKGDFDFRLHLRASKKVKPFTGT
jgi:hypothetical protein